MADPLPELKLLQLFDVLYTHRSVTRTAEQLGQSQPTVSIWLGRLREQLRDPLFVRTPTGMMPTPRADALIVQCREILESLRRLAAWESDFQPATAQRRFRLCMTDASHITLLPRLLAHLRTVAPGIGLEVSRIDGNTARALESGEADLALGYAPWLESGIYQQTLFPQDWVCLANSGHPRVGRQLTAKRYFAEAHIAVAAGTGQPLLDAALKDRPVRRVLLELPSFLGLAHILSTTDLIATLPRQIGETLALGGPVTVHACPLTIEPFDVKQHWHARYHHDAANRWLRGMLATLFMRRVPAARKA